MLILLRHLSTDLSTKFYLMSFPNSGIEFFTSSSVDFPEEDGAPEGFNAREVLGKVFSLAKNV